MEKVQGSARFWSPVLVDAHVHFHPCFERLSFLDGASRNFAEAAKELGFASRPLGVLMFADAEDERFVRRCREEHGGTGAEDWNFEETREDFSVLAWRHGRAPLLLLAGRQILTAENLEVLALACDAEFPDKRSLERTLESVRSAGALPVLPWGFGKWHFGRGRLVAATVKRRESGELYLGDIGGRLRIGFRPKLFLRAEKLGIRVLPGSDPLPFPGQVGQAGSRGFVLESRLDLGAPGASLKEMIRDPRFVPRPYGKGERLVLFLRNQLGMQLRKARNRS